MVGALREGQAAHLMPQRGVTDVWQLARAAGDSPLVTADVTGDVGDLRPAVDAAVYRLTQESITNAVRQARHATRIDVRIDGYDDCVRLTVVDDGDPTSVGRPSWGYGIVGMTERAALLGGTLEAGPEIADELYISLSTVKTHLASLMGKLGTRNRVEMAMWAYETGRMTS